MKAKKSRDVRADNMRLYDGIRLLPVILFVAVLPLIVRVQSYTMALSGYPWISGEDDTLQWDVFSLCKLKVMAAVALLTVIIFIILYIKKEIKVRKTAFYIPMGIYTIAVLLSYAFSDHKDIAWLGGMERFEGTLAILCYMVMLFYTIQAVRDCRDAKLVLCCLGVTVFTECVIGLTQLMGCDVLFSSVMKRVIAGGLEIEPSFEPGQVYQTVANMNYVPFWLCLVTPLILLTAFYCIRELLAVKGGDTGQKTKGGAAKNAGSRGGAAKRKSDETGSVSRLKTVLAICVVLLLLIGINCAGAGSIGGVAGMALSFAGLLILLTPKRWMKAVIAAGAVVLVITAFAYAYRTEDELTIDHMKTGSDRVEMTLDGQELAVVMTEPGAFTLYGEGGEELEIYEDDEREGLFSIDRDGGYAKIALESYDVDGGYYMVIHFPAEDLLLHYGEDGVTCCNPYGYEVTLDETEHFGFDGHFGFATGRGYIWSASLPLIARRPLFGTGADTFMMVFPQTDYAGKISSGAKASMIVDKAHNLYIQMAVTTGLVSLAAFIAMMVLVFMGVRRILAEEAGVGAGNRTGAGAGAGAGAGGSAHGLSKKKVITAGTALGIAGFLFAALFCDSTVSVMPVFYGLLGMLVSLTAKDGTCALVDMAELDDLEKELGL